MKESFAIRDTTPFKWHTSACLIFVYFQLFAIVVEFSLQLLLHLGIAWVVNEVVMFQWVGLQVVQFIVIDVGVVADVSTVQHAHVSVVFACARYALVFVFCTARSLPFP